MSFPEHIYNIPQLDSLTIFINDEMHDSVYLISSERYYNQTDLYIKIEDLFMNQVNKNPLPKACYVTCNIDSAFALKDYIDSWVSERRVLGSQGRWKGA